MSYSTPAGLRAKWPKLVPDALSDAQLQIYLDEAWDAINSRLAVRYQVPIANPSPALVQAENDLAFAQINLRPHIGRAIEEDATVAFDIGKQARKRVDDWADGTRVLLDASGAVVEPAGGRQPIGSTTSSQDPQATLDTQDW